MESQRFFRGRYKNQSSRPNFRPTKIRRNLPRSASETASYLAELTAELALLARAQGLDMVAYLLEMAQLEAQQTVQDRSLRDFGRGPSRK